MTDTLTIEIASDFVTELTEMTVKELEGHATTVDDITNFDAIELLKLIQGLSDTEVDGALLVLDIVKSNSIEIIEVEPDDEDNSESKPEPVKSALAYAEGKLSDIDAEIERLMAKRKTEIEPLVTAGGLQDLVIQFLNDEIHADKPSDAAKTLITSLAPVEGDIRIDAMWNVDAKRFEYGAVIPTGHTSSPTVRTPQNGSNATSVSQSQWFIWVEKDGKRQSIPMRGDYSNRIDEFNSILWNQYGIPQNEITMTAKSFDNKCKQLKQHGFTWERGAN